MIAVTMLASIPPIIRFVQSPKPPGTSIWSSIPYDQVMLWVIYAVILTTLLTLAGGILTASTVAFIRVIRT